MSDTINVSQESKVTIPREVNFHFKKDDLGNKRPSVALTLPVPTVDGIIAILEAGGKGLELLLETVADVIYAEARQQVNEPDFVPEKLDTAKLGWDAIANMPKAERRGGGISKETWEAFGKDYIEVMPAVTGKSAEQLSNAAKILLNKFQQYKTNKPVLKFLKEQLGLWFSASTKQEEFADCYEFLNNKVDVLLAADAASLLANL